MKNFLICRLIAPMLRNRSTIITASATMARPPVQITNSPAASEPRTNSFRSLSVDWFSSTCCPTWLMTVAGSAMVQALETYKDTAR